MNYWMASYFWTVGILVTGLATSSLAADSQSGAMQKVGEAKSASPIPTMSREELIKLALSAAPASISKNASVMIADKDGKLIEAKKGTNGFVCIPDLDGQKKPDPMCADAAAWQWTNDFMSNAPKPTNTVPGIAYMAQGGWRWEKDGKILMKEEPGAKLASDPPHWMMFWKFNSAASGIPASPGKFGTYIMFEGTPYAHLMIEQDPKHLK